jgi:hypothetical protein
MCGDAHHQFQTRSCDCIAAGLLVAPAAIDTDVTQDVWAHLSSQGLDRLKRQDRTLMIVRRLARNANELKAECEPYNGQREYGRFHGSHQQQEL